ncbi:MAG: methyltransferase domain-containing protein [Chloroflexota bacterium]
MPNNHQDDTTDFYTDFFTQTGDSISRYPNPDEVRRANQVLALVTHIATQFDEVHERPLRILDMGCGRGWLTFMLSMYGDVVGVEPVHTVAKYAQKLYPDLEFIEGTSETLLNNNYAGYFDVIVSSEVIEHVPYPQQQDFMRQLATLLHDEGSIVMTTPRGEIYDEWMQQDWVIAQPVEDWVTEARFDNLIRGAKLDLIERQVFRKFAAGINRRIFNSLFIALGRALGFQAIEPRQLTVYQIVWLSKQGASAIEGIIDRG